jgi:ribosomal protein S18 acetylase RimI-like enzyme
MPKKPSEIVVETYAPFARYRSDLLRVEARCFGPQGDNDAELEESVKEALFLAVVREGDKAFGYCLVKRRWPETAYIAITAIDPAFQKKGHLARLIAAVEDELRLIGYTHIERNCRIANGYADKVAAHYGARAEVAYDHGSLIGPLRFFRIRLAP